MFLLLQSMFMENKKVLARDGWEASCVGSTRLFRLLGAMLLFNSIRFASV